MIGKLKVGQKIGFYTIVEDSVKREIPGKSWRYICRCDCGEVVSRRKDQMYQNHKRCPLRKPNKTSRKLPEIVVGKRFGQYRVIKLLGPDNNGNKTYLVECPCGERIIKIRQTMFRGHRHCPLNKKQPAIVAGEVAAGRKVGRYTVLRKLGVESGSNSIVYECRCDCDRIVKRIRSQMRKGHRYCSIIE